MKHPSLIGIDLGATNIRVARVENKEILQLKTEPIITSKNPSDLIDQIKKLIQFVITGAERAIGIGVPSVVDVDNGIVFDVQNIPAWKEVPLKSILENEFKIPVFINNDANCYVLGEKYFGKGQSEHSIIGLTLGTGLGAGVIMNGKLISGENCGTGEVGMIPYLKSIFEHYCSGQFFEIHKQQDGKHVYKRALDGDLESISMYKEFGKHLGNAIKVIMYVYDPAMVILGGSVSKAFQFFSEDMHNAMKDFAYPKSLNKIKIIQSELENVAVLGAAALALDGTGKLN